MQRFKNIVYLADGAIADTAAFEQAAKLAVDNQASLTILAVWEDIEPSRYLSDHLFELLEGALDAEIDDTVERLRDKGRQIGIEADVEKRLGKPFLEAVHAVSDFGFDLLVKTARPPSGTLDRLLGSTDHHLVRKCPCPVWIEPESSPRGTNKILAAVDPQTPHDPELEGRIVELASSMAERRDAELHLVHAWRLPGESMLHSGRTQVPLETVEAMREEAREDHRKALEKLLERHNKAGRDTHIHLREGAASDVILSVAREEECDLLVMGTVGRVGIPGLFISNTAEDALNDLPCAVLAIKPEGFVSPVQA
ncbi:MAG: universal stress protein [Gammaproteobacteria bacterium]